MKLMKDKVAKLSFVALLLTVAAAMFYTPAASAHGEKSQAAFMRMRTIHWYDLNWSKVVVKVNDTMTISSKFLVFSGWPETVDKPESAFLNIGIPGPVFIRAGSWIGGQLVPRSVSLELGETYEFKVLLKARRPGDWHVHTMMNVGKDLGKLTVEDIMQKNPITVDVNAPLSDVLDIMLENGILRIPVTDGLRLVGIISRSAILRTELSNT